MLHRPIGSHQRRRATRDNARSVEEARASALLPVRGRATEKVTLPRKHSIFHAMFYPQMY
jgi:hypothetical protein